MVIPYMDQFNSRSRKVYFQVLWECDNWKEINSADFLPCLLQRNWSIERYEISDEKTIPINLIGESLTRFPEKQACNVSNESSFEINMDSGLRYSESCWASKATSNKRSYSN